MRGTSIRAAAAALAFAFLAGLAAAVHAAPVQKVAIVSAFGDAFTVVTYQPSTGSRLDRNEKQTVPVPDHAFDTYAVQAGKAMIAKTAAGVEAVGLDVEVSSSVGAIAPAKETRVTFPEPLAKALAESGASHVLLLSRARAEAALRLASGSVGSGMLEGIGFYVDTKFRTRRGDTGESGTGFLAPFAYLDGALIDVATGTVERTSRATEGTVISAARATGTSTHPWSTLDPAQKVDALKRHIRRALEKIVPELLATP